MNDKKTKKKKDTGGTKGAVKYFLKTFIALIVVPSIIYFSIPYLFDAIAGGAAGDISAQMKDLEPYFIRLILCAIPMVIISIPLGYFARGDKRKVPCRIAYGVAAAALVLIVTNGGKFNLSMADVDLGAALVSSFSITLTNTVLVMIIVILCLLKGLLGILEYRVYRDEFNGSEGSGS